MRAASAAARGGAREARTKPKAPTSKPRCPREQSCSTSPKAPPAAASRQASRPLEGRCGRAPQRRANCQAEKWLSCCRAAVANAKLSPALLDIFRRANVLARYAKSSGFAERSSAPVATQWSAKESRIHLDSGMASAHLATEFAISAACVTEYSGIRGATTSSSKARQRSASWCKHTAKEVKASATTAGVSSFGEDDARTWNSAASAATTG
mmetsp:Transcript_126600/g.405300  ORF Transcript_126600/g.405300 Transcript_126600/m.405300 type:complete len:211 (-) Transcript_126600:542-1174(-)